MPKTYMLINTEPKNMEEVMEILRSTFAVQEIYPVYGPYDLIVKIRAETTSKLKEIVTKVRGVDRIRSAVTILIIEKNRTVFSQKSTLGL
jgi:DNA-binding Lrp family transcriptional regulator